MFPRSLILRSKNLLFPKKVMNPQKTPDYEACIEALNNLQSNAQYIKLKSQATGNQNHNSNQLKQVQKYLIRTGLSLDKLDELSVIHVAGTKGKGTTCAFSERILREHGYKTGFFSSPHLFEVRERIRINGKPISKDDFTEYFWKIYSSLDQQKDDEHDMPLYFRFLTIMAFNIFLDKKVDVAVIEVGIGGEYDCTNILRKVPVVGITSLGIDHTSLLGSTIESIAWNKAGIMKEGCRAFTVPQPEAAMKVLQQRSIEKRCQLDVIDNLQFKFQNNSSSPAHILSLNASLAVALCETWLSIKHNNNTGKLLSKEITQSALSNCIWPGRFQVKQDKNITYYLDGAHTLESITICSKWFKEITKHSKRRKALMFNVTGNRDAGALLNQLKECHFDTVLFVTNVPFKCEKSDLDNHILKYTGELLERCRFHKELWLKQEQDSSAKTEICEIFPTIIDAIVFLTNQDQYDLLVTGSIHLVGNVLSILDPDLNENS